MTKKKCILRKWADEGKMKRYLCYYDHRTFCEVEELFGKCRWML